MQPRLCLEAEKVDFYWHCQSIQPAHVLQLHHITSPRPHPHPPSPPCRPELMLALADAAYSRTFSNFRHNCEAERCAAAQASEEAARFAAEALAPAPAPTAAAPTAAAPTAAVGVTAAPGSGAAAVLGVAPASAPASRSTAADTAATVDAPATPRGPAELGEPGAPSAALQGPPPSPWLAVSFWAHAAFCRSRYVNPLHRPFERCGRGQLLRPAPGVAALTPWRRLALGGVPLSLLALAPPTGQGRGAAAAGHGSAVAAAAAAASGAGGAPSLREGGGWVGPTGASREAVLEAAVRQQRRQVDSLVAALRARGASEGAIGAALAGTS